MNSAAHGHGWKMCPSASQVMAGMYKGGDYVCSDSLGCIDQIWCCEAKPKRAALRFGPSSLSSPQDTIDDCRTACLVEAKWGGPFQLMAYDEKEDGTRACSCEYDVTRATAVQGGGNSVFDLSTPQGMEADENGNWACLAPPDGTTCPGGDERPCAASPMCVSDGRLERVSRSGSSTTRASLVSERAASHTPVL